MGTVVLLSLLFAKYGRNLIRSNSCFVEFYRSQSLVLLGQFNLPNIEQQVREASNQNKENIVIIYCEFRTFHRKDTGKKIFCSALIASLQLDMAFVRHSAEESRLMGQDSENHFVGQSNNAEGN